MRAGRATGQSAREPAASPACRLPPERRRRRRRLLFPDPDAEPAADPDVDPGPCSPPWPDGPRESTGLPPRVRRRLRERFRDPDEPCPEPPRPEEPPRGPPDDVGFGGAIRPVVPEGMPISV